MLGIGIGAVVEAVLDAVDVLGVERPLEPVVDAVAVDRVRNGRRLGTTLGKVQEEEVALRDADGRYRVVTEFFSSRRPRRAPKLPVLGGRPGRVPPRSGVGPRVAVFGVVVVETRRRRRLLPVGVATLAAPLPRQQVQVLVAFAPAGVGRHGATDGALGADIERNPTPRP